MKIVKFELKELDKRAVEEIALVEDPAIGIGLTAFESEKVAECFSNWTEEHFAEYIFRQAMEEERTRNARFEVDESKFEHLKGKGLVFAPLMVADKLIPRVDAETGEPYYGYFDREAIEAAKNYFNSNGLLKSFNIEHDHNQRIDSIELLENWTIEDSEQDKAAFFGYNLEPGSWVGMLRFADEALRQKYSKDGAGFSVEAYLTKNIVAQTDNGRK